MYKISILEKIWKISKMKTFQNFLISKYKITFHGYARFENDDDEQQL